MKHLVSTSDTARMARLRQFMLRQGIPVTVSEQGSQLELWVVHERYYEQAQALLEQYIDDPADQSALTPQGTVLGPTLRSVARQAGVLTFAVFILTLIIAALQFFGSADAVLRTLLITAPGSTSLDLSQPWRLLTPAFIHLSATHLLFNLFWWWYLGGRIELRLGAWHLLLILLVTGISANLLQWYTSGPLFGGLSGVVYGLLGFCAVYGYGRQNSLTLPPALISFMVMWLLLGYTNILWVNMANEAHLMGLISGLALGAVYRVQKR